MGGAAVTPPLTPAEKVAREVRRLQRDWRIVDAYVADVPLSDIAGRFGLTPQRVGQIVRSYQR
jgi:hypothetical protein